MAGPVRCKRLFQLLKEAHERQVAMKVVVGAAPGWADPWSRVQLACAAVDRWNCSSILVDEEGFEIPRADVQLARLAT